VGTTFTPCDGPKRHHFLISVRPLNLNQMLYSIFKGDSVLIWKCEWACSWLTWSCSSSGQQGHLSPKPNCWFGRSKNLLFVLIFLWPLFFAGFECSLFHFSAPLLVRSWTNSGVAGAVGHWARMRTKNPIICSSAVLLLTLATWKKGIRVHSQ